MSKYKRVLITGGAGFIGSHVARELLAEKIKPVILDNLSVGKKENVPTGCDFLKGDINDYNLVRKIVKNVDAIIHLAATVTIRGSLDNFYDDAHNNVMGTLNLLRACKESQRIKKFIFSSSMAVYADSKNAHPLKEDYLTKPISPYGVSKLACESYVKIACKEMGIENVILRYFNTFGEGQTFTPYVGVITIFINRLLEGKPPIIYGDGRQKRDFIYVGDVADATVRCLLAKIDNEIINISTGKATSVNKIASLLIKKINPKIKPIYQKTHPGELRFAIADNQKLKKYTGFVPQTSLEEKIDSIIGYIKKNKSS